MDTRVLVAGAGGFIGHHLVKYLKARGYWVRGVDVKRPEYELSGADEFILLDLREKKSALDACAGVSEVYQLAATMGGIGFIETHKAEIVYDNTLINMNMVHAAANSRVNRYLFTSSACVYPGYAQNGASREMGFDGLEESEAYPADPEDGYGWEKLYAERMARHAKEDWGLDTRVVRFHNIYGPLGTYDGGREKSPAAISRKIALAQDGDTIEVWGDGTQTRSYCYIDDCVEGIYRLMRSHYSQPINLGSDEMISINELVDMVAEISGKTINKRYDLNKPQGVRSRNSSNVRLRQVLEWEPSTSLRQGMAVTYKWIESQMDANLTRNVKRALQE